MDRPFWLPYDQQGTDQGDAERPATDDGRYCAGLQGVWGVLPGLAPRPLAAEGSVGYRAASHGGPAEDAVLGMWIGSRDGATRAHRPGLAPVPLPRLGQAG